MLKEKGSNKAQHQREYIMLALWVQLTSDILTHDHIVYGTYVCVQKHLLRLRQISLIVYPYRFSGQYSDSLSFLLLTVVICPCFPSSLRTSSSYHMDEIWGKSRTWVFFMFLCSPFDWN